MQGRERNEPRQRVDHLGIDAHGCREFGTAMDHAMADGDDACIADQLAAGADDLLGRAAMV
jgi:hypothetical protein